MKRSDETRLMRHLLGEASDGERRELEARLARDPEVAGALARLAARWSALELPPPAAAPPGFATSVLARLRAVAAQPPLFASAWMRAAALAALLAGMTVGGLVAGAQATSAEETLAWDQTSLAEEYLSAQQSGDVEQPLAEETR